MKQHTKHSASVSERYPSAFCAVKIRSDKSYSSFTIRCVHQQWWLVGNKIGEAQLSKNLTLIINTDNRFHCTKAAFFPFLHEYLVRHSCLNLLSWKVFSKNLINISIFCHFMPKKAGSESYVAKLINKQTKAFRNEYANNQTELYTSNSFATSTNYPTTTHPDRFRFEQFVMFIPD